MSIRLLCSHCKGIALFAGAKAIPYGVNIATCERFLVKEHAHLGKNLCYSSWSPYFLQGTVSLHTQALDSCRSDCGAVFQCHTS